MAEGQACSVDCKVVGCRAEGRVLTRVDLRVAYMGVPMATGVVVEVGCCIFASVRFAGRVFMTRVVSAVSRLGVAEAEKGAGLVAVYRD